jgi:hypothetical protein
MTVGKLKLEPRDIPTVKLAMRRQGFCCHDARGCRLEIFCFDISNFLKGKSSLLASYPAFIKTWQPNWQDIASKNKHPEKINSISVLYCCK